MKERTFLQQGKKRGMGIVVILKNLMGDRVRGRDVGGLWKDPSEELEASTDIIWIW